MWSAWLGKGLREPCSPYRTAYFFGAPLNSKSADDWNCLPEIVEPTDYFDLSESLINTEVCVGLVNGANLPPGTYYFNLFWYKGAEQKPFYRFTYKHDRPDSGLLYAYSFIGYVPWEISANGDYRLEINISGPERFLREITFTVSGIPEKRKVPSLVETGIQGLIDVFESVSAFFYAIYLSVSDWVWPFKAIATPFLLLSVVFTSGAEALTTLAGWTVAVVEILASLLTWESIKRLILSWLPGLEDVISWFSDWWNLVKVKVDVWWSGVTATVKGWIDVATQGLAEVVVAWNNFWTTIFPNLINWTGIGSWWNTKVAEVEKLIDTAFTTRDKFWAGWQEIRTTVLEFFADPLEWLWGKFADWFLGPEGK